MSLFKKKIHKKKIYADNPLIIAGLGNPGPHYRQSRHNAGFLVVERLAEQLQAPWQEGASSGCPATRLSLTEIRAASGQEEAIVLLQPLQFMNLSGSPVAHALRRFKSEPARLLVIHDEIELPFAEIRLQYGGGHRGHNGIRDIHAKLQDSSYHRLRFGVGRPEEGQVADYVLSPFSPQQRSQLEGLLEQSCSLCLQWIERTSYQSPTLSSPP